MSGEGWSFEPASDGQDNNKHETLSPSAHKITVNLEKRNKGKVVTVIGNLALDSAEIKDLAKKLKAACGSGGSSGDNHIEIQGDHVEKTRSWLRDRGWGLK
ncbi:MAG: translation initiation factor [Planctomycetes bacterium]|nr:translation initiation factor [Planctomycetota bacterium]